MNTRSIEFERSLPLSSVEVYQQARKLQAQEVARVAGKIAAALKQAFAAQPETAVAAVTNYKLSPREQAYLEQGSAVADFFIEIGEIASRFGNWLASPAKSYFKQSAMRNELTALDDRTLADIGLTRGDIERVASGLWVPENRSARISQAAVAPRAANRVNKPQIAA